MRIPAVVVFLALVAFGATRAAAQTALTGWHRDGQTWLVWNDTLTFTGVESVSIHRSSTPFTSLADVQNAERIGRLYPEDYRAARLHASLPGGTWTIPDAAGNARPLLASEGLFVYTPHAAVPEYFAVIKTEHLATGPFTAVGPIAQTVGGVKPHAQHSGLDAGHPYTVYTLWIDGRADHTSGSAGFPVMGSAASNGTAWPFAVFEPVGGLPPAPMPAVVFLHGGGGSYWNYRPSRSTTVMLGLHVGNGLYVTLDENLYMNQGGNVVAAGSRWFGTCDSYDRFADVTVLPPNGTPVVDFSQRRIAWILDWLQAHRGVDAQRTALAGLSMGGRGTHMFVRARPERISASLSFVMPTDFDATLGTALMGSPAQNLPTTLAGAPGIADVLQPYAALSPLDRPFSRYVDGTTDTVAPWPDRPLVYDTLNAQRTGAAMYWDGRGHTASSPTGWAGQYFVGSPKHAMEYLTRYRADQSFPAVHDVDHVLAVAGQQPDPGDPVTPANGDPHGTWGGWFDWDPASIVDTAATWSCRLWLETTSAFSADNAPLPTARASVTLRRRQAFVTTPHEVLWVELARATAPFTVLLAGAVQAGADGAVTLTNLPFGGQPVVLTVRRGAAGGALVPYGIGTAGCAGVPAITGNVSPQVNTPGFVVVQANAPANGLGIALFGERAANAPLLGITLHVELLAPPAILLPVLANGLGAGSVPVAIPGDPALVGYQLHTQTGWLDGCAVGGFAASRGLLITIQP